MAATSRALIAVTKDAALKERAVALAATLGMTENEVEASWRNIVVSNADNKGKQAIADVYEDAFEKRYLALAKVPPEVGEDLSAVTDENLLFALRQALKDKKEN